MVLVLVGIALILYSTSSMPAADCRMQLSRRCLKVCEKMKDGCCCCWLLPASIIPYRSVGAKEKIGGTTPHWHFEHHCSY